MSARPAASGHAEPIALSGPWRALIVPRPASPTVALCWLVDAGSRLDGGLPGRAWLTRQLALQSPDNPGDDLVAALEAQTAAVTCRTTREYSEFAATIAAPFRDALLRALPRLARPLALDAPIFEQGRLALLSAAVTSPAPSAMVSELLLPALWPGDPFARPARGTTEGALALTPAEIMAWHGARYQSAHTVLAVVGACTTEEVAGALAALPAPGQAPERSQPRDATNGAQSAAAGPRVYDAGWERAALSAPIPNEASAARAAGAPALVVRRVAGEVAHVAAAVPVVGMHHPARSALRLLDYVLGRGGSSRLYRELRERRGLVYTCHSAYMPYADRGLFMAQAICAPARAGETLTLLQELLFGLADQPPSEAELCAAQTRYAGALYRTFEPNASLAAIVATETLLADWEPFEASIARVNAVTCDELARTAHEQLRPDRLGQVVVSPLAAEQS